MPIRCLHPVRAHQAARLLLHGRQPHRCVRPQHQPRRHVAPVPLPQLAQLPRRLTQQAPQRAAPCSQRLALPLQLLRRTGRQWRWGIVATRKAEGTTQPRCKCLS